MARIYRVHPDSSYLTAPRVLVGVFVEPGELVSTVRFYEQLTRARLDMDADIPEAGLHVVAVGSFLGSPRGLGEFSVAEARRAC